MKYLILIISVLLLIASVGGSSKDSSSIEVNETIANVKALDTKTLELKKESALEQRLADVV